MTKFYVMEEMNKAIQTIERVQRYLNRRKGAGFEEYREQLENAADIVHTVRLNF